MTGLSGTLLRKVAADNGFDQELPSVTEGGGPTWLAFASSHAPLQLWLTSHGEVLLAAFSQAKVLRALEGHGVPFVSPLPPGAVGARGVSAWPALHQLVRRSLQLSRTLPDELYQVFRKRTEGLPRATEIERLVVQRVGQDVFRAGLFEYWEGRCAVTGLTVAPLLRASHIKPWASCATDEERLDVFNGLLLAAHLDVAFDRGLLTVEDDGQLVVSTRIGPEDRSRLGLEPVPRIRQLAPSHHPYLAWHRQHVFDRARQEEVR